MVKRIEPIIKVSFGGYENLLEKLLVYLMNIQRKNVKIL